ncbi:hypothetical protein [Fundidesulfovibrio agrisoli]|uniref:hypothetical protein n=1 Tax=Fundidesulfovibrio agrisoli TaxID=2922717 RepID=UPI001FAB84E4|nr:hypothetical protein [Fundidesulfovibrio agrisoli]
MTHSIGMTKALKLLGDTAADIRRLEAEAAEALHGRADKTAHRELMLEKCELLADLPENAQDALGAEASTPEGRRLLTGAEGFARRANQALDLESIFYMSALLYPDDYQDGDPNDLERFIATFKG